MQTDTDIYFQERPIMIKEKAHAKINLSLDVTGRRDNGYHEVRMIMQTLDLCDELTFSRIEKGSGIILKTNSDVLNSEQDAGQDNLIVKAVNRISQYTGTAIDVEITLDKNIPIAAGMAGGSADAAATLRGINRLFELGLSDDTLCEIAVKIGADVPFCVREGIYLSEGIGEVLTKLPKLSKTPVVICKPDIFVSTKDVYGAFDSMPCSAHPDVDAMLEAVNNDDIMTITGLMGNVLEPVTVSMHPVISKIEEEMENAGAIKAIMSGSGPTVFGIFDSLEKAKAAADKLHEIYPDYSVCSTGFFNPGF